jgi:hypothetical protein
MAIPKKLIIVFTFFYIAIIIYLLLFLTIPEFQAGIINARKNMAIFTEGSNYLLALLISFFICLIGNASIGFPIPYPFVLFSLSQPIYYKYSMDLVVSEILGNGFFWFEILGITVIGGLGSILGEMLSFLVGLGTKKVAKRASTQTLKNVKGFGRLVLEHPKSMYLFIFAAAALPIPDDPLWIALGMSDKKINITKCIIWGWLGKNITTFFYAILPLFIILGYAASGIDINDISSVITEAVMLLVTLSVMFFILTFNWGKFLDKRQRQKLSN